MEPLYRWKSGFNARRSGVFVKDYEHELTTRSYTDDSLDTTTVSRGDVSESPLCVWRESIRLQLSANALGDRTFCLLEATRKRQETVLRYTQLETLRLHSTREIDKLLLNDNVFNCLD